MEDLTLIKPIVLTDNNENKQYTLEFNRDSVVFTNRMGFKQSEFMDNMEEMLPILFFGAFRMHHKNISRAQTDKIMETLGGLSDAFVARLIELYAQPRQALMNAEVDYSKNVTMTVEGLD